jgi:hypothetical protein
MLPPPSSSLISIQSLNGSPNSISENDIEAFCKNISNIRSVQTNSILQSDLSPDTQAVSEFLSDPYDDPLQVPFHTLISLPSSFLDSFTLFCCFESL